LSPLREESHPGFHAVQSHACKTKPWRRIEAYIWGLKGPQVPPAAFNNGNRFWLAASKGGDRPNGLIHVKHRPAIHSA